MSVGAEANYIIIDNGKLYQEDVKQLPQLVKEDLEEQLKILKRDPYDGTEPLRGRYKEYRKKRLVANHRLVSRVNINSHKIILAEVKHRGASYRQVKIR